MLEAIGAGVDANTSASTTDFAAAFRSSHLHQCLLNELDQDGVARPSQSIPVLHFDSKRAAPSLTQARLLLQRFFRMYWRTPAYNWTRLVVNIFLGVLFGAVFFNAQFDTYQGINGGLGMVFMTTAFLGIVAMNSIIPVASEARATFYRERAAQMYNAFWYFVASTVVEIPYIAGATLLFSSIFFPMAGFSGVKLLLFFWLNTVMHVLIQNYLGQLLSFALSSVEVATMLGVLLNSIAVLFMGFNPPASAIPQGYRWLFDLIPQRYSFMLLSALLFGECSERNSAGCAVLPNVPNHAQPMTVQIYRRGLSHPLRRRQLLRDDQLHHPRDDPRAGSACSSLHQPPEEVVRPLNDTSVHFTCVALSSVDLSLLDQPQAVGENVLGRARSWRLSWRSKRTKSWPRTRSRR